MSEFALNLLNAIESGDKDAMDLAFSDALSSKITDALDAKKIEVAQSIYSFDKLPPEVSTDSGDNANDIETSEDGTEEV